uniref:Uncharacterized protein n=1 Tax=Human betaherpesvirus 6 TaxID=10368 RepID=A0A5P9SSH2_9BETA|nr:hypothetical protein [Human betaherpesvirus 6]
MIDDADLRHARILFCGYLTINMIVIKKVLFVFIH